MYLTLRGDRCPSLVAVHAWLLGNADRRRFLTKPGIPVQPPPIPLGPAKGLRRKSWHSCPATGQQPGE